MILPIIKFGRIGKVDIDWNEDLRIYEGLDEIISVNPLEISYENKDKILQVCDGLGIQSKLEY